MEVSYLGTVAVALNTRRAAGRRIGARWWVARAQINRRFPLAGHASPPHSAHNCTVPIVSQVLMLVSSSDYPNLHAACLDIQSPIHHLVLTQHSHPLGCSAEPCLRDVEPPSQPYDYDCRPSLPSFQALPCPRQQPQTSRRQPTSRNE